MASKDHKARLFRVGFVGLGNMGNPMALNLLKHGHKLAVYDRDPDRGAAVARHGASLCERASEVSQSADAVFLSLPGPPEVEEVALQNGLIKGMKRGSTLICVSTVSPECVMRLADAARVRGVDVLDAPVASWTREIVGSGQLTIIVGGERDVLERCRPLFDAIGRHIHYVGPIGTGSVAKLITNMLMFIQRVALYDALALGVKAGISAPVMGEVIQTSGARSVISEMSLPVSRTGRDQTNFPLALCCKDLRLTSDVMSRLGSPQPLADLARDRYDTALKRFGPGASAMTIATLSEEASGVTIRE
jgi:3-hydroxyisobutyrate dehydrogenase-like beta-hydroxyacid dehydrogenase